MTFAPTAPTNGRHSPKTVAYARRLAESGWSAHDIRLNLARQGVPVSWATVRAWVDEDYRHRRNRASGEDKRRGRDKGGEYLDRCIREMDAWGLSPAQIRRVVARYHGLDLSVSGVRWRLRREQAA